MVACESPQVLIKALGIDIVMFITNAAAASPPSTITVEMPATYFSLNTKAQYSQLVRFVWRVYWHLRNNGRREHAAELIRRMVAARIPN